MTPVRRRRGVRRSRAALLAILVLGTAVAAAGPAVATETDTMRLTPSPLRVDGQERRAFTYDLEPGQRVSDAVRITNLSDAPRRYLVYGADAHTDTTTGAITVPPSTTPARGVGTWITTDARELALEPGASAVVAFTVARPEHATAEGLGAVVAEELAETPDGGGVEVVFRLAVVVQLDGAAGGLALGTPRLDAPLTLVPSRAQVTVDVTNTTLEPARAAVRLEVAGASGRLWALPPREVVLAAGESSTVAVPWTTVPRWGGVLTPRATVTWASRSVAADGAPLLYPPVWLVALLITGLGVRAVRELRTGPRRRPSGVAG